VKTAVASEVKSRWALAVVAFGVFVAADDLMVVATMLRPMIDDFELVIPDDLGRAAWIVNVYLVAYIAVMPIAGRLSDVLGRRAVFCGALVVFAAGSVIVPAASSLFMLLVGRALTAIGGGALVPLAFAVAGDLYHGPARARALGLLGAIETFGWVWGPLYGAVLVRFLSWQWQFHLNVPLALAGVVVGWRTLDPTRRDTSRVDWPGSLLLTAFLTATGIALLGQARIQSVTGLDDLTGGDDGPDWRVAAAVAVVALVLLGASERRSDGSLIGPLRSASSAVWAALAVNVLVGVGLVVALINVPLFINIVGGSVASSAVRSGWLLTALTAALAATTYLGGEASARAGNRAPVTAGTVVAAAGMAAMGWLWAADTAGVVMAAELAVVGAGIGLVLAPTSAAVVDDATTEQRGAAAGLVVMARLIGFSIGLAALTTWSLHRYEQLRADVVLPALTDPGYAEAATEATIDISTSALAETFAGGAIALSLAAAVAYGLTGSGTRSQPSPPATGSS
jgi:MFS family permease